MANLWVVFVICVWYVARCEPGNAEDVIDSQYEPKWRYKCTPDEGCQRAEHPEMLNITGTVYQSLDICRSVCGRFGGLWPRPVTAALSSQTVRIHPNYIKFDLQNVPVETRSLLVEMQELAVKNLLAECDGTVTELVETPVVVYLNVKSQDMSMSWETNEQYMVDVQSKDNQVLVHIVADTVYGARHGLETFTQLAASDKPDYSDSKKCGLHLVAGAKIRDRPVYKHRGLLLDTSRHFIPMKDIKRTIDGMAASKLNVFHWHATDTHSFPLESARVPQFTRYGAYSAAEIYSVEEQRELIHYAQVRGIRVIIEIDSPAHAGNGWQWGKEYGYGDLALCVNQFPWRKLCIEPPCGQLNPANAAVYRVLGELYRDLAELLPQPAVLHMGGDEVWFECWNSTEEIINYMESKHYDTSSVDGFRDLWSEFHEKALQVWDEQLAAVTGSDTLQPVLVWSSDLTQAQRIKKHFNKDRYIIQVWEPISSPLLLELTRMGYRTISVPKDIWYLDHGFWGVTKYSNWRKMYGHTLPRDNNILGGEVAMWTEYLDEQGLDTRIWPRAAAVAERLWLDPSGAVLAAEARMQRHRARLVTRGIQADAIGPAWCAQHDSKCF